jgi:hypothetical protein
VAGILAVAGILLVSGGLLLLVSLLLLAFLVLLDVSEVPFELDVATLLILASLF